MQVSRKWVIAKTRRLPVILLPMPRDRRSDARLLGAGDNFRRRVYANESEAQECSLLHHFNKL